MLELVLLTCTIGAHDKIDVKITNIQGPYMSTEIDNLVVMVLRRALAYLLILVDPSLYRKYMVIDSNRKPIFYIKLQKFVYSYIRVSLLFYEKISCDLKAMGFVIKPYHLCMANNMFNGKQFTLLSHMDDLKLSHVDEKKVKKLVK